MSSKFSTLDIPQFDLIELNTSSEVLGCLALRVGSIYKLLFPTERDLATSSPGVEEAVPALCTFIT